MKEINRVIFLFFFKLLPSLVGRHRFTLGVYVAQ